MARVGDSLSEPRFLERRERGYAVGSLLSRAGARAGEDARRAIGVVARRATPSARATRPLGQILASAAAQALRTAELRQLALTDSQTLAYNRRYLLPRLRQEMERAQRHAEPLSLLLIDLDHFKRVNDRHGHAAGDAVLAAFADRVRSCVRAIDVLFRRGGEEFVLIMPATDEHHARDGRRARAHAARRRAAAGPRAASRCSQTVSIGVATWDGCETARVARGARRPGDVRGQAPRARPRARRGYRTAAAPRSQRLPVMHRAGATQRHDGGLVTRARRAAILARVRAIELQGVRPRSI